VQNYKLKNYKNTKSSNSQRLFDELGIHKKKLYFINNIYFRESTMFAFVARQYLCMF